MSNNNEKKLHIVLSAFACEPMQGSEGGLGWNIAKDLSNYHNIWLVTDINNKPQIEEYLKDNSKSLEFHIIYHHLANRLITKLRHSKIKLLRETYYLLWQSSVFQTVKKLTKNQTIDITHHITFVRYWTPSSLAFLDIPFIWGPVGGEESCHAKLLSTLTIKGKIYERGRNIAQKIATINPLIRQTAKKSALAFAATPETELKLKQLGAKKSEVLADPALSLEDIRYLESITSYTPEKFIFISYGRMLEFKGYHLSIQAFINAKLSNSEYWVIGNGPGLKWFQKLAQKNADANIKFINALPRNEVFEKLAKSNVLVHPSFHESGGWTYLEAMAAKKPVIYLDISSPNLLVGDDAGIKIKIQNQVQIIDDLSDAMNLLYSSPDLCEKMGNAGQTRVLKKFNCSAKAQYISRKYHELIDSTTVP